MPTPMSRRMIAMMNQTMRFLSLDYVLAHLP
jgi:hypothetical protein